MIISLFVLCSLAVGGLAFFRTRKMLNTIRERMSGTPQSPKQNDANIIEGEYKVIDNDEKKP